MRELTMTYKHQDFRSEDGFTLIELAIVILAISILMVSGLQVIRPIMERADIDETREKMDVIVGALASYAQRHNRLPCPSDPDDTPPGGSPPFGAERGSGGAGANMGSCTGGNVEGIVPFRTLGLDQDMVVDGWGRFISYRVSPTFTKDPNNAARRIHRRCWTTATWFGQGASAVFIGGGGGNVSIGGTGATVNFNGGGGGGGGGGGNNVNLPKARFCCPDVLPADAAITTDIRIIDDAGARVWLFDRDTANYFAETANSVGNDTVPATGQHTTTPAFILVSHGRNGLGAFLPTGARLAGVGGDETENADGDRVFRQKLRSDAPGANYFDDIVLWHTQDTLFSLTGGGSCAVP